MSTPQLGTQTAAARRVADAHVRELVARVAPGRERLIATMRRSLRKRLPTAHELVYEYKSWMVISFSPNENGYDGLLAIRADADSVDLYFNHGKEMPDPEKLLQGSAKLVRLIPIEGASTLTRPAVATLIEAAIARNRLPFARTGLGSVVIRSAAAKKPNRRRPA